MENDLLISICVPAFNCGKFIAETLRCLCDQTYRHIEIIVVNDGSTDDTASIVEANKNLRISLINVTNGGAAKARNIAYQHSKGSYIVFFDADDFVGDDFIAAQFRSLGGRTDCIAVSGWGRFYQDNASDFRPAEERIDHPHTLEEWIVTYWYRGQHNTPPGRLFIPREIIRQAGPWNEELTLNDDFEFFTRIALRASLIIPNPAALYYYRTGINGLSAQKNEQAYLSLFKSMEMSFDRAIKRFKGNDAVKRSCANLWQSFIYEVYPQLPDKRSVAENAVHALGGSNLSYPAGGLTRLLAKLFGWKTAKRFKMLLKK